MPIFFISLFVSFIISSIYYISLFISPPHNILIAAFIAFQKYVTHALLLLIDALYRYFSYTSALSFTTLKYFLCSDILLLCIFSFIFHDYWHWYIVSFRYFNRNRFLTINLVNIFIFTISSYHTHAAFKIPQNFYISINTHTCMHISSIPHSWLPLYSASTFIIHAYLYWISLSKCHQTYDFLAQKPPYNDMAASFALRFTFLWWYS